MLPLANARFSYILRYLLMFTTIFMNNDNLRNLSGHPECKSMVWVELKDQSLMKIKGIVLLRQKKKKKNWMSFA